MANALQVFDYKGANVRTVERDGEVWFVAKDVCDILEIKNSRDAVSALDDDEKMTVDFTDGHSRKRGGAQFITLINEPGLYGLIFRSNKPEAKQFSRWVKHEVLPQIHRTGGYSVKTTAEDRELKLKELELKGRELDVREREVNLQAANALKEILDTPPFPLTDETRTVLGHELFRLTTNRECLAMLPECTEKWYTATEIGEHFGLSANMVGRIAKKNGLQPPVGESNEYGRWIFSKSMYSIREVPSFIYSQGGFDWFEDYENGMCREA